VSVDLQLPPHLASLARALGVVGPDGGVDAGWFEHPLEHAKTIVSDRHQRAALFRLLDSVLPSTPGMGARGGARWYPLLEQGGRGNVYLTVDGDRIGVAAAVETPAGSGPRVRASLRLPLVDASGGQVSAVAGSAAAPLEVALEAGLGVGAHPSSIAVVASADVSGNGSVRVVLEDLDPADPLGTRTELDPARLDAGAVRVIEGLLRRVLTQGADGEGEERRVAFHLPGVLGLDPALPALPLARLLADAGALRAWLAALAADGAALGRWFGHLAGLLGAGPPDALPALEGDGSAARPFRVALLELGDGSTLDVTLAAAGEPRVLRLGVALGVAGGAGRIEAGAVLAEIPLGGSAPATALPAAHLRLVTPASGTVVDAAPDFRLGSVAAGMAWDGTRLAPELELRDVVLQGRPYARLDLTSAHAVVDAASGAVRDALSAALGGTSAGLALQALIGLVPPAGDPGTTHLLDLAALVEDPLRAVADVHRGALARSRGATPGEPRHGWEHLFAEVAALLGVAAPVAGAGTAADPWRVPLAGEEGTGLELAAWNASDPAGGDGVERLRIGLRLAFRNDPWQAMWRSEVLGFDLASGAPSATRFLGSHHLSLALAPVSTPAGATGVAVDAASVSAAAEWVPGRPATCAVEVRDLVVSGGGDRVGPVSVRLPSASFDPAAPDLGLGVAPDTLLALLRLLVAEALQGWGGGAAVVLGGLLGVHRRLGGLPADWPLLEAPHGIGALLEDPFAAVRTQAERVMGEASADGTPFLLFALPWLRALLSDELPERLDEAPALDRWVGGGGTYAHPWVLPVGADGAEVVCWMEPDGPPAEWQRGMAERLRASLAGASLRVALEDTLALLPGLEPALRERAGADLDRLERWLARGDGFASAASQHAVGSGWTTGTAVDAPHHELPSAPAAVAQVVAQLDAWAADGRAVVLLSPPFADHRAWSGYLRAVEPARPADAHFDFRAPGIDPLAVDLGHVDGVATHYTADLAHGDDEAQAAQLLRVAERVRALTGRAKLFLVAHSTAGIAARAFAAEYPELVAGVVTLGTPHGGGIPAPLADEELADAVRFARALLPEDGRGPAGRAVAALAAALDDPARYPADAFDADWMHGAVPGLAIPGVLQASLVAELAASLAERAEAAADGAAPPTHLAYGARVGLDLPEDEPGEVRVRGRVRFDVGRRAFLGGAAEPARPARSLRARLEVDRADGRWLVGEADSASGVRLRSAELGVDVEPAAGGGAAVRPVVRLHGAGAGGDAGLDELLARLPSLPPLVPLRSAPPAPGTPARWLADAMEALGILVRDATGALALSLEALAAAGTAPATRFGPRLPALLDAVAARDGAAWTVKPAGAPLELVIERDPWRVRLRTRDPERSADTLALAPGLAVGAEVWVSLPDFAAAASARVELADARLAWSGAAGTLTLAAEPWLEPVALVPPAPAPVLRAALGRAIPVLAASTVVSAVLNGLTGPEVRVRGVARLLTLPGAWLRSPDALGAEGGGLDPARVGTLLEAAGAALGLPATGAGELGLPGGLRLSAAGQDPLTLSLAGPIALGGTDVLDLQLGLAVDRDMAVSPAGGATLRVALPGGWGGWGGVAVAFGADAAGVSLAVTPDGAPTIALLPRFGGFGALAEGAASLLPAVLQEAVDAQAPDPTQATGLLRAALSVAKALGLYDFDPQGFRHPDRAAELRRMLEPGWLEEKAGSGPAVVQALGPVFQGTDPLVDLPGTVAVEGSVLRWSLPVAGGGTVSARLGWTGTEPALTLFAEGLRLGPVVAEELLAGWDGGLACRLALRLEPEGALAFLRPALVAELEDGRFGLAFHPLGAAHAADLSVRLAPVPEVVLGPGGPAALAERWGFPLAARLLLEEFGDELGRTLWAGGPTVRAVLDGSGLVRPGATSAVLASPLPSPAQAALGALKAAAVGATIQATPTLALSLVADGGRRGIRLRGRQALGDGVGIRFGDAEWIGDDAGVTLWLLDDAGGPPRIAPALDVAGLGVVLEGTAGQPLLDGAFEVGSAGAFLFLRARFLDAARRLGLEVDGLGAGAEVHDARIRVAADDADGFLKTVLPPELQAPFYLGVAWRDGALALHGGTPGQGLELTFPLDLDFSVIRLAELVVALRSRDGGAVIEGLVSGGASLGPVRAAVQRVGVRATLGGGGVQVGFRAPDGVGLTIDAGMVVGGGYLEIDEARGQYAGALTLQLQGLSLAAIGILSTRYEDGSPIVDERGAPGFSLLVVIAAELPPVQLGFGFTLNGIGGLLGLNRTMDREALRAGVRNRTLDSILFPADPAGNAPALVRTLNTVFPLARNRLLLGPMVRLGWGTPPILTLDLAVLVDLPGPTQVAVLGRMRLVLPREESPIVAINLDVVGHVHFGQGEVSLDAKLYDSTIAGFALTGDMALRANWKHNPGFALAVGGFHPAFRAPANFPKLERLALSLSSGNNPRLRMEAYLAVTSNSVQFGAAVDLHAEALGFELDGHLAFDALIYLEPFGLDVSLDASVSVRYQGATVCAVGLHMRVRGPGPWHVQGSAHIELLFISATVRFDARIGKATPPPPLPPVRVDALLRDALAAPENWSAQPPGGEAVVSLRSRPGGAKPAAHPLGGLTVRQRVAPLDVSIQRFGSSPVEGARRFSITEVRCGEDAVDEEKLESVRDSFAAGQFFDLTESQKLSRPSFEPYVSGVALRFDGFRVDGLAVGEAAPLGYKLVVVDEEEDGSAPEGVTLDAETAAALAHGGAAAHAETRRSGPNRFAAPAATVKVKDRGFAVVPEADALAGPAAVAPTYAEALEEAERLAGDGAALAVVGAREEIR